MSEQLIRTTARSGGQVEMETIDGRIIRMTESELAAAWNNQAQTVLQLQRELKDTRDELEVYRLASETAVYEASQFDRGLFLSGDRGVEDVMRRVLEALKVARSEATQAKAQAAFVAAERDQLRQEKEQWRVLKVAAYVDGLGANLGILYEEFQKTLNYFIEANKRKRAAQNDARRLAAERDGLLQLLAARSMHKEDELRLAESIAKAEALYRESKTPR